jgi:DinB family protein
LEIMSNTKTEIEELKFPLGKFEKPKTIQDNKILEWIGQIELFPTRLADLVNGLSIEELDWQYRPDGWTIKHLVHHCADSHMNSFVRFKLTLTEDQPIIKPYFEDKWAELPDSLEVDVSASLKIIEGLHLRWAILMKSLTPIEWTRELIHPEHGTRFSIGENIALYAWHSNHHLAHIKQAILFNGPTRGKAK